MSRCSSFPLTSSPPSTTGDEPVQHHPPPRTWRWQRISASTGVTEYHLDKLDGVAREQDRAHAGTTVRHWRQFPQAELIVIMAQHLPLEGMATGAQPGVEFDE